MNSLNYGTLEACKKLHDAGIVLETEKFWGWDDDSARVSHTPRLMEEDGSNLHDHRIPAPTLAEVWRELPEDTWLRKVGELTKIMNEDNSFFEYDANPTDAAIYLLIWLKEKGLYEPQRNV